MGGALIIMALVAGTVLWCDLRSTLVWLALLVTVGYGAIGFLDDYLKLSRKNKKGLPGKLKLPAQFVIGGVAVAWLYLRRRPRAGASACGSRCRWSTSHHRIAGAAAAALRRLRAVFVLMAESNARQPDRRARRPGHRAGDHLRLHAPAARPTPPGTTLRGFNIAQYLGMPHVPGAGELAVFCGAMGGAGIGFLWFNTHPAQVFMGDVGALALGGAIGFVALATKTELSLPIIGGVFVVEALSDIIQVGYYKRDQEAHLPDGAHPPPLREAGLAGIANRGAFLDRLVRSARF